MRRNENPHDSRDYTDWMIYAENDLKAAKILCTDEDTLLLSAFHSHQAIEKSLKAFMLSLKGYAPDGHNIIYLCKSAVKVEPLFSDWIDECLILNNFYVQTRYPPDFPLDIDTGVANRLYNMAQGLYNFTLKKLAENNL